MSAANTIVSRPYTNTDGYRSKYRFVFSWIMNKLAAIQAHREKLHHIALARQMDVHFLKDMGIDQVALWQHPPRLCRKNDDAAPMAKVVRRVSVADIL